jgi:undecaprenyl-diphosphatase
VLYDITDWLGLVPILFAALFGALGLSQWIKRSSLGKVDRSILILGGFYAVTVAAYLFFEYFAVNFRPVLIDGRLEASYPSSTTLLTLCVMPTAVMQFSERIKNLLIQRCVSFVITVFALFMTLARLVSGVHWFTDIIGGVLLSASLVFAYRFFSRSSGDNL